MAESQYPGVTFKRLGACDRYAGAPEAIIAAGLARPDEFPGQPGRPKTQASYLPDGRPASTGDPTMSCRTPGRRTIRRMNGGKIAVDFTITREEFRRRLVQKAPELAPLFQSATLPARAHLGLVWSRPASPPDVSGRTQAPFSPEVLRLLNGEIDPAQLRKLENMLRIELDLDPLPAVAANAQVSLKGPARIYSFCDSGRRNSGKSTRPKP